MPCIPYQSLNPKYMIVDIVAEPLRLIEKHLPEKSIEERVVESLEFAGLKPGRDYLYRYPHELSGGQRQRVAIAAVFIISPDLIIADEPVSMLNASIRAGVVKLMFEMREIKGTSYLFITHDLSLAWLISNKIAIMYLGLICEMGTLEQVYRKPLHPYTQALLTAVPIPDPEARRTSPLPEG